MNPTPEATEIAGRHVDRRATRHLDRHPDGPVARHVGRHAAVTDPNVEPTDASAWAAAYSDGADRAGKARSRSYPESRVDRRGRRRRRDRA